MNYISPHFTRDELVCRCGCGTLPPASFIESLEVLRVEYAYPMHPTSCARCGHYNAEVSTTGKNGPHTEGAIDVAVYGHEAHRLVKTALSLGWSGIGISQKGPRLSRFVHLDRLKSPLRPWVWSY